MRSVISRAAAVAVAVVSVISLAGCTEPSGDRAAAQAPAERAERPPCQDSIAEGCRELSVDGRDYRYYVSPPKSGGTGEALLVDLGGPGISLSSVLSPDYGDAFRKDLGVIAEGKTLILVEEPWVSGKADAGCRDSSARFYAWVRRNWRDLSTAETPAMNCPWGQGVYGWSPQSYRAVIEAVTARERTSGLDMAAISFGAVRYTYIDDLVGHVTLVRPAAKPGTSSATVVAARSEQVWKALAARCPGCRPGTIKRVAAETISNYAGKSAELADRSVPVTDFDVASSLVAAGISTADVDLRWESATATLDVRKAAQLSDALWMRIGVESVSPALVAYTDEYCQAYPAGTASPAGDPIRTILDAPNLCAGQRARPVLTTHPVDCLIAGAEDASAPAALARTWNVADGGISLVSRARRHWFTDTSSCVKVENP
jgi:hypothetical protein